MNLKEFFASRFKDMYIMTADISSIKQKNLNGLTFSSVTKDNYSVFQNLGGFPLRILIKKGSVVGAFMNGEPVAVGGYYTYNKRGGKN